MSRFDHLLNCNNEKGCLSIKFDNNLGIDDKFTYFPVFVCLIFWFYFCGDSVIGSKDSIVMDV